MKAVIALLALMLVATPAIAETTNFDQRIEAGETFSYTFTELKPSGYYYTCALHGHSNADRQPMVHVEADTDGISKNVTITISSWPDGGTKFAPQHAFIQVGDTVIWNNTDAIPHHVQLDPERTAELEESGDGHGHANGDDHHHESTETPGFGLVSLLGAVGLAALFRRR